MVSLDTNVLVRIFVDDPQMPQQTEQARLTVSQLRQVYITKVVQVETVWVLKRAYGFTKPELLIVLEHLRDNRAFVLEEADTFRLAVALYQEANIDFSDALILAKSRLQNLTLLTFDHKLSKLEGVMKLSELSSNVDLLPRSREDV
jgi:predicted nucleic-acid-binding protein